MSELGKMVLRLCRVGIMAALYLPLALFVAIRIGTWQVSFGSLPVVVTALLFGPVDAFLVAAIGEFFKQLLTYGFTATTVLYLIPPALRGFVIGLAAVGLWKSGRRLEERRWLCYLVCICAAMITTLGNTMVNWADSLIYGYYTFAYVFGNAVVRFITGMVNSVVIATVAIPLVRILRKQGFMK